MRQLIVFSILAVFTIGSPLAKPLYKWVDENGKIQYSDAPPAMPQKKGVAEMSRQGIITRQAESDEEKQSGNVMVKSIDKDSELTKESFDYKQHFTQPPAHYTEASLVKTLEELGIGRPSTYAPTISTIITRRYVAKENKNLYMTELGEVVNNIMKQSFASIVDVNFTAYMEGLLDMIAEGKVEWKSVISNFYPDLKEAVEKAEKELETVKIEDEVTDVVCEECGRNMVIKFYLFENGVI